jgi:hypothetical protein
MFRFGRLDGGCIALQFGAAQRHLRDAPGAALLDQRLRMSGVLPDL